MRAFSDFFRCCAICGSGRFPIDVLCEMCWSKLFRTSRLRQSRGFERSGEGLELYSLLLWNNDEVGTLLHSLKGENHRSAFRRLATIFSIERSAFGAWPPVRPRDLVFVPAPPKTIGGVDHAQLWAEELAAFWGATAWPCLQRVEDSEQKRLSRPERNKRRLELMKNLKGPGSGRNRIVFCDDVYTTGATARAAFHALGKPTAFEVWTVACRPRLFGV